MLGSCCRHLEPSAVPQVWCRAEKEGKKLNQSPLGMWQGSSDHTSNGQGSAEGMSPLQLPHGKWERNCTARTVVCDGARAGEEVKQPYLSCTIF